MLKTTAPAFAAGAIFAVIFAGGGAAVATGGNFLLGHSNTASKTTTLSAPGTALALKSQHGPALTVNNTTRVPNLNADRIDGLDSDSFARTSARTGTYDDTGYEVDSDENGYIDTIAAYAECPPGTQMTGGGGSDFTYSGWLLVNAPDPDGYEGWVFAVAIDEADYENPSDVTASVTCWDPNGQPSGSYKTAATKPLPAHVLRLLKKAPTKSHR